MNDTTYLFHYCDASCIQLPIFSRRIERKEEHCFFGVVRCSQIRGRYGMGYERYFQINELFRYSLRGGLSYDPEYKHVPLFLGNSLMFGKRHNIEMGFNFMRKYLEIIYLVNSNFNINKEVAPDNLTDNEIV